MPGLPGGLGHLSAGSENPQVVAETFLAKIGSDIALFDPGRSYKKAIELLEESGGLGDRLRPDRIFSSIGQINRTFPSKRRLDLQWLHGFLGYRFFWRKRPSEWLQLFAADVSDEQPEYKRICEINVPEEWNGIGQWVHVVIDYERREDRRRENTRSRSGSRRTDKPKIDEEEEKRVLIPLYLQSPGVDPAFPSLRHKEYESRRPLAAFLGAFLLDPPKSDQFYYLASQRFKSIE